MIATLLSAVSKHNPRKVNSHLDQFPGSGSLGHGLSVTAAFAWRCSRSVSYHPVSTSSSSVGARTGARALGSGGDSTAFAVARNPAAIVTFPAPASSNAACGSARSQTHEPEIPIEVREWIGPAPVSPDLVLVAQPPPQPRRRVHVEHPISTANDSYTEVVGPAAQRAVQLAHQLRGVLPCSPTGATSPFHGAHPSGLSTRRKAAV